MAYNNGMFQPGYVNSYGSPTNFGGYGVDPQQAGWNVNSAYMTPSYMAGYRPNYTGNQNFQMPNMGFGRGLNVGLPTPFQPETPFYMSPLQYREQGLQGSANKVSDAAVTAVQYLGATAVGLAVTGAMTARAMQVFPTHSAMAATRAAFGGVAAGSIFESAGYAGGRAAGAGAGRFAGHALSGLSRLAGFGGIAGAGAAGGAIGSSVGAFAGAVAGWGALPLVAGMGISEGINQTLIQPYVAIRRGEDAIKENLRNMSGMGSSYSPLSVNSGLATSMGAGLSREFSQDLGFKPGAGAEMFQYGMQAGLYRNIGKFDAQSVRKKTKEIAEQVKTIMDVFNEPSMQDAIAMIGQMSLTGGATGKNLAGTAMKYKYAQAMTGTSSQQLANTIGQQGQMMYGQSGILPYLGQVAALNTYTGLANAKRSGLISTEALAMVGGLEGATQGSMEVKAGLAQTTYNRMTAMNMYYGVGGGGINNTLAAYGNKMSSDPLSAVGNMVLKGDAAVSEQLRRNPLSMLGQVRAQMDVIPGMKTKDGKYDMVKAAGLLSSQGFSNQQVKSIMMEITSYQDKSYVSGVKASVEGSNVDSFSSQLERSGLNYAGPLHYEHALKSAGASMQTVGTGIWESVRQSTNDLTTAISEGIAPSTMRKYRRDMNWSEKMQMTGMKLAGERSDLAANSGVMYGFKALWNGLQASGHLASTLTNTEDSVESVQMLGMLDKFKGDKELSAEFQGLSRKLNSGGLSVAEERRLREITGKDTNAGAKSLTKMYNSSSYIQRVAAEEGVADSMTDRQRLEDNRSKFITLSRGPATRANSGKLKDLSVEDFAALAAFSTDKRGGTNEELAERLSGDKELQKVFNKIDPSIVAGIIGRDVSDEMRTESIDKLGKQASMASFSTIFADYVDPKTGNVNARKLSQEDRQQMVQLVTSGQATIAQAVEAAGESKDWLIDNDIKKTHEELTKQAKDAITSPEGKMMSAADTFAAAVNRLVGSGNNPLSAGMAPAGAN